MPPPPRGTTARGTTRLVGRRQQVPGGAAFLSAQICAAGLFFYGYSEVAMQALANVHPVTRALIT